MHEQSLITYTYMYVHMQGFFQGRGGRSRGQFAARFLCWETKITPGHLY